jgi:hypothetical protein
MKEEEFNEEIRLSLSDFSNSLQMDNIDVQKDGGCMHKS